MRRTDESSGLHGKQGNGESVVVAHSNLANSLLTKFRTRVIVTLGAIVLLAFLLTGCGGGGTGLTGSSDQIIFDNGHSGPVSDDAKSADETTLEAVVTDNPSATASNLAKMVVAKMRVLPDFHSGGISTSGDPWGEFTDGSVYGLNLSDPGFLGPLPKANQRVNLSMSRTSTAPVVGRKTFPAANIAFVIHGVEAARVSPSETLAAELGQAGYKVTALNGAISDWSQVSGAGILINDGHGATVQGRFYVSTTDSTSTLFNSTYARQLKSKSLIVLSTEVFDSSGAKHTERRYWLDIDFLKALPNYNTMFSGSSLFMDVVCSGDSPEARSFWGPLMSEAGLSAYGGWQKPVDEGNATQTALFFFDRALGLNQQTPIDPSLPPPGTVAATNILLSSTSRDNGTSSTMNMDGVGNLFTFHLSGDLTTIVPSIASVAADSDPAFLVIKGEFGVPPGTVTYGGAPVTASTWTDSEIKIPFQSTGGAVVVKSPSGLISNSYTTKGIPALAPLASVIHQGDQKTLTVTVGNGVKGTTYGYQWIDTGLFSTIKDKSGHSGPNFSSDDAAVTYSPKADLYGTDTVTVEVFAKQADGSQISIGKAKATVETAPSGTVALNPQDLEIDQTKTLPVVASITGGVPSAVYSYNWTNSAVAGAISDAHGHSGPTFTSPDGTVTYKPQPDKPGTDTVTVEVFVVAKDGSLHRIGKAEINVTVITKSLIFTPADGIFGVSESQLFTVAPLTGTFPAGATFTWNIIGFNGESTVNTNVPAYTYVAPSKPGTATMDVTVKDSQGKTIAEDTLFLSVQNKIVIPSTLTWVTTPVFADSKNPGYSFEEYYGVVTFLPRTGASKYVVKTVPLDANYTTTLTEAGVVGGAPFWDPSTGHYLQDGDTLPTPYAGIGSPAGTRFYNVKGSPAYLLVAASYQGLTNGFAANFSASMAETQNGFAGKTFTVTAYIHN